MEELREAKVDDVKKVALAIWEADGKLSVFLHPEYEPLTPASLKIKTEPFDFPRTIIMEGRMLSGVLCQLHKKESWVISRLESLYQTEVQHVLLATLDGKDQLTVFLYK